ncbi:MAG: hypothetical protein HC883_02470 [Bdellovibrionaceae bacterium]|nr:hypothetical protein [Pseudobdellovibrionaceae bacterium]
MIWKRFVGAAAICGALVFQNFAYSQGAECEKHLLSTLNVRPIEGSRDQQQFYQMKYLTGSGQRLDEGLIGKLYSVFLGPNGEQLPAQAYRMSVYLPESVSEYKRDLADLHKAYSGLRSHEYNAFVFLERNILQALPFGSEARLQRPYAERLRDLTGLIESLRAPLEDMNLSLREVEAQLVHLSDEADEVKSVVDKILAKRHPERTIAVLRDQSGPHRFFRASRDMLILLLRLQVRLLALFPDLNDQARPLIERAAYRIFSKSPLITRR